jgi:hypothetical protein
MLYPLKSTGPVIYSDQQIRSPLKSGLKGALSLNPLASSPNIILSLKYILKPPEKTGPVDWRLPYQTRLNRLQAATFPWPVSMLSSLAHHAASGRRLPVNWRNLVPA